MATLNLVLDTRRARKDGTYPLAFRIRIEKKFCDIGTGFSIKQEDFDPKTNSIKNDQSFQLQLETLKGHYHNKFREYITAHIGNYNLNDLKSHLINKPKNEITIKEFWENEIVKMESIGKLGNARTYKITLSTLANTIDLKIPFSRLNLKSIKDLEHKLLLRNVSINGMSVYMRTLRAICNKAIDQEIVGLDWYPFKKFKIRKEKTTPRVLTLDEIRRYFKNPVTVGKPHYQSYQIGKLIFMLRGINLRDLLLLSSENIKGNRLIYKRSKTGKLYNIGITKEIRAVFQLFIPTRTSLLGVLTDAQVEDKKNFSRIYQQKREVVNDHLKKIGLSLKTNEAISTYVFRYTFPNVAKQIGISKDCISELLGHSSYGNAVTSIYLEEFDVAVLDEIAQRVIDAVK